MLPILNILKNNSIFLLIGSREIHFVRFSKGKILSTRSHKISYEAEQNTVKHFFKDFLAGKEGVPICVVHDTTNQSFTDYTFPAGTSKNIVHQSIIKKINHDITQEAIHGFFKTEKQTKGSELNYQVVSFIKTPLISMCLDFLHKFPNPIAGHFSTILEMRAICEGSTKRIQLPKTIPVIEQDELEQKERSPDDFTIAIHQSPISGINFALYHENKVLFSHIIVCGKIDEEVNEEINSTISAILDYCEQNETEYSTYICGNDALLKVILETKLNTLTMFYTHPNIAETKFFYHKQFNMNFSKGNALDSVAFKCLYEPTFFLENKTFSFIKLKEFGIKFGLILLAFFSVGFFLYQLLSSSSAALQAFTKYSVQNTLNVAKVINDVQSIEKDVTQKKNLVEFYTAFDYNNYNEFFKEVKNVVRNSVEIKNLSYSCFSSCNNHNAKFEGIITGKAPELQDYYSLVSDLRRIFYRHEIERKVNETNGEFTIKVITTVSKTK